MIVCVPPRSRVAATRSGAVQGVVREDGDRQGVGRGARRCESRPGSSLRRECRSTSAAHSGGPGVALPPAGRAAAWCRGAR